MINNDSYLDRFRVKPVRCTKEYKCYFGVNVMAKNKMQKKKKKKKRRKLIKFINKAFGWLYHYL